MREIIKKFVAGDVDIVFARLSVIIVLAVMGNYKWFEFEVEALKPLFSQTWLSFLPSALGDAGASYFFGVVETVGYLSSRAFSSRRRAPWAISSWSSWR